MSIRETKKAVLVAKRAFERASSAASCSLARNNLQIGQKWTQKAWPGVEQYLRNPKQPAYGFQRKLLWDPERVELSQIEGLLPAFESAAHQNFLRLCKIAPLQWERDRRQERIVERTGPEKAIERRDRKRSKRRGVK